MTTPREDAPREAWEAEADDITDETLVSLHYPPVEPGNPYKPGSSWIEPLPKEKS